MTTMATTFYPVEQLSAGNYVRAVVYRDRV